MSSNAQDTQGNQQPSQKMQIYSTSNTGVTPFWKGLSLSLSLFMCVCVGVAHVYILLNLTLSFSFAEKYERDAKKYWDIFYKRHEDRVRFLASLPMLLLLYDLNLEIIINAV